MTGRMYLGPVRDMEHAGWLQARFEGDTHSRDETFAAELKQSVTVYCLQSLAYHLGFDAMGDAAPDTLSDALSDDGIALGNHDAAKDWLADNYSKHGEWCDHLANRARVAAIRKRKLEAKQAVWRFIAGLFA